MVAGLPVTMISIVYNSANGAVAGVGLHVDTTAYVF